MILGDYTDVSITNLKMRYAFGQDTINYIVFQTLIILFTLYIFVIFLKDFTSEFQKSIAGSFFIVIYFGMQTNYLRMIKEYLASFRYA